MYNYIVGAFVILMLLTLFYMIGKIISKSSTFTINLLSGYFVYSFLIAVVFIPIQILKLSWGTALIAWLTILLVLIGYITYEIKRKSIVVKLKNIKKIIKENYFLIFISFILLLFMILSIKLIWLGNHQDDGFYLNKIATLPYLDNPFDISYASGMETISTGFDSYLLNTWELELSVITFIFKLDSVFFARFYISFINYLLFSCSIVELSKLILKYFNFNANVDIERFTPAILLFFTFSMTGMSNILHLNIQDAWQFNSAMFYGSTFVRTVGFIVLIVKFINLDKISISNIFVLGIISIVLISKSTVALPVIIITSISLCIIITVNNKFRGQKLLFITTVFLLILLSIILPNNSGMEDLVKNNILFNIQSPIMVFTCLIVLFSFFFKVEMVYKLNFFIILFWSLILIPGINNLFELSSQYHFVAMRAIAGMYIFMIIIAFIYSIIFLYNIIKSLKKIKLFCVGCCAVLVFASGISLHLYEGGIPNAIRTYLSNPMLMPKSTIMLSEKLESLSEEKNLVLMPSMVNVNGYLHPLSVMVRTHAQSVLSISSLQRFAVEGNTIYSEYTLENQQIFDEFASNPTNENYDNILPILKKYNIDFIVINGAYNEDLHQLKYVDNIIDLKNNISYTIYEV